jgi:hypothetical protein
MVSHYCGNSPAGSGKSRADLQQALVKEKDRKKRSSSKAEHPYGYLDFARRFHSFSETIRARVGRCAYPEREQIYAEQRPISSGDFAQAVQSLRRAPKQVR